MSKADKMFSMKITETQREIMDFVASVVCSDMSSKAQIVIDYFRGLAKGYCDYPDDIDISDEQLLSFLNQKKREKDKDIIRIVGVAHYKMSLEENKDKLGEKYRFFSELLKEVEAEENN